MALQDDPENLGVKVCNACSAPHNRGDNRKYYGVSGHLFSIGVQSSLDKGYGGYIYTFARNPKLKNHYCDTLGGVHVPKLHPYCVIWNERRANELRRLYNFD